MSELSSIKAERLIRFLRVNGFMDCRASATAVTLRDPDRKITLTIPTGSTDLGRGLVIRALIDAGFLHDDFTVRTPKTSAITSLYPGLKMIEQMERQKIVETLKETSGNKLEAAKRLGIGRQTLYNKIKAYSIEISAGNAR